MGNVDGRHRQTVGNKPRPTQYSRTGAAIIMKIPSHNH